MKFLDDRYQIIHLVILIALVSIFWHSQLVYPIKLFVVMLHEMSHALMAVIFGGEIIEIQIDEKIGGYCKYKIKPSFWSEFMIASAGYLGSLFWGAVILILAVKTKRDEYITLVIGFILLGLSYYVYQSGEFFGTAMTVGLGLFMLIAFKFFNSIFHDLWLKFIGITSCIYVIIDIKHDLIDRTNIGSDADAIAQLTGWPSVFIGVVWIIIAAIVLLFVARYIYKQKNSLTTTQIKKRLNE